MLIEFSVSNFRSFREKQTFSMVAAPRLKKKGNTFRPAVLGEQLPELLKVAAIYGPNASGKSNLIKAFQVVSRIAERQPSAEPKPLPVAPFRFDPALSIEPSCFEFHFIHQAQRYEFELTATSDRIVSERLVSYPKGKETLLYERHHGAGGDYYVFGAGLEGGRELHEAWRKLTGPQMLFIAQAVANSNEDLNQLRVPLHWLMKGVIFVGQELEVWAKSTQELANKIPRFVGDLSSFLQAIDVPVTDIRFDRLSDATKSESTDGNLNVGGLTSAIAERNQKTKTTFVHKTKLGQAEFDFAEESDGTKNLIGFWLPWTFLDNPRDGYAKTLIVDELDSSLHPMIVASLVEKHLQNNDPAQLIFTTHDTHLMDTKLLRRDQFWLTERDANGATSLRSIHDFEGREGEDVEKRYYEGRYRGLPFVRKG